MTAQSAATNCAGRDWPMPIYQPKDQFYRKAREKGLPSRAAFKLEELLARYRLVKPDARIVDLGCAPGGWLAILAAAAPAVTVVGVDLVPCRVPAERVRVITGDIREPAVQQAVSETLGGRADLITSDIAPKLSGIRAADEARAFELLATAAEFAEQHLKPGGSMIAKVFMSEELRRFQTRLSARFAHVDLVHTQASRPGSRELYVVARRFDGGAR